MVTGVFSFVQCFKEIPSINLRTNLGVSISLGLFLLYLVAVFLGTWADNRRPKSRLKRSPNAPNSQSSRRPEPYLVAPDEFKEFKEDPDESAEVEKKP